MNWNRLRIEIWIMLLLTAAGILWIPVAIHASEISAVSYAVVVGSNRPGQGQDTLQFARDDADRFGDVLKELGGYLPGRVKTIYDPDANTLKDALNKAKKDIAVHSAADEKTVFLFYYSGHARATALNLGAEELSLAKLRALLNDIPATLKIVVLDACQTGAISAVKGAAPTADFSFNSVNDLKSSGMAVIASSAATEPAQETPRLKGSFFTHHLTAALRGAGDTDGNGRVTLEEAYRYTYNRTLVDTAETAVGKQHVSLETDLTSEGETVLSWPSGARARFTLPEDIEGDFLVYRKNDKTVMAEIHKTRGDSLTLALPPGKYETLIRQQNNAFNCNAELADGSDEKIDLRFCRKVSVKEYNTKGLEDRKRRERVFLELGMGTLVKTRDRYVTRLNNFGYKTTEIMDGTVLHYSISLTAGIIRYLQAGVSLFKLDSGSYLESVSQISFSWNAHAAGAFLRVRFPVAKDWVVPYIQAGGGAVWGKTLLSTDNRTASKDIIEDEERFVRYHILGGGGIQLMPWRFIGFLVQVDYTYAPVIDNLIGDVHNSGGTSVFTGVRGGF